ncbi:strictosidine synthase 1-like protein, partial [Trifolium pratense]
RDFQTVVSSGSGDNSGSLLRYDPSTNQTTVLLSNLTVPAGVAVSINGSFVLVSEYLANRIQRVWLKGPRANSSELFMQLAGRPDNIKRNSKRPILDFEYGAEAAIEVQEYNGTLYGGSILASYATIFTP